MSIPSAMRSTIEVYRRMIFIYHGLLNFVLDGGKFLMDANFNLEDKVVSKEVGIDRNMDQELGLDSGSKPKNWKVYSRRNKKRGDVAK
jgi:hypothetical protein